MKPRVLVSKHVFSEAIDLLSEHAEVDYHDSNDGMPADELRRRVSGCRGLVCQLTDRIDGALFDAAPDLAVVSNVAVGFDNIDVPAATKRGILVSNTPEVLTDTTADFAFALMLATARRIPEGERFLRAGRWRQWEIDMFCGLDVHHRTLGLFGIGRIGQAVARRARGFDMRVLYNDVQRLEPALEKELGIEYAEKGSVLRESDFISLHVPLLPATRHLVGRDELRAMKKTAILVNTARGPIVDEAALADALAAGEIAAAGLDVFEREPEVHEALLGLDNAVLVPHIASASVATRTRMCTLAAENCIAVLTGGRPPTPLNPEVLGAA